MVQENSLSSPIKEKIIVIAGPTGIGKSAYGVKVAQKYNGEIVSADSVQIYRGLDIGSGKITKEEMQGITHHLLDVVDPYEEYTVVDFILKARSVITDIIERGKLPVVVGGTGFYINALLHGYNCGSTGPDKNLRNKLKALEEKNGSGYLYKTLNRIDPVTTVMQNDYPRIVRSLELLLKPRFDKDATSDYDDVYDALLVIMDADRDILDNLAEKRIRTMIDAGLENEVKNLKRFYETKVLSSVGYREMKYYISNSDTVTLEDTITEMRQSYHQLIKKQQTFFRWLKWNNKISAYNGDMMAANAAIKKFVEPK